MTEEDKHAKIQFEYGAEGAVKLTWLALFLTIGLIFASGMLFVLYKRIPEPKYFAVNSDNKFFTLPVLSEPSLSLGLLQNWVTTFVLSAHTFDFQNYDKQLVEMKKYFTDNGYKEYLMSMAGFSENVKGNQLLLSCTVLDAPAIQRSTTIDNHYEWFVTVPIIIRYDSASTSKSERRKLSLVIKRVDTNANPYGIGVSIFNSEI